MKVKIQKVNNNLQFKKIMQNEQLNPQFLKLINKRLHYEQKLLIQKGVHDQIQVKQQTLINIEQEFGFSQNDWNMPLKERNTIDNNIKKKQVKQSRQFNYFQDIQTKNPQFSAISRTQNKKLNLQNVYKRQKHRNSSNSSKIMTQLDEITSFNKNYSTMNSMTIESSSNKMNQQIDNLKQTNNLSIQNQQVDFFSMADSSEDEIQQQVKNKNDTRKLTKLNNLNNIELSIENSVNQENNYFQTQKLLIEGQTSQEIKLQRFSTKNIAINLNVHKMLIHIVFIIVICILYGFINSMAILIIHDISSIGFIAVDFVIRLRTSLLELKQKLNKNAYNKDRSQQHLNQISDQIIRSSQNKQQHQQQQQSKQHQKFIKIIKIMLNFHQIYLYAIYFTTISFLGYIIFLITQIDTFFTPYYFSFSNWSAILLLLSTYLVEIVLNCKIIKQINKIIFYQQNALSQTQAQINENNQQIEYSNQFS